MDSIEVLNHLYEKNVIDTREFERIEKQHFTERRFDQLVLLILKRSSDYIEKFFTSLHETNQKDLVDYGE